MTTTQQQIAELAYRIWEQQGRPEGCDREHWEQARQQLEQDVSSEGTPGVVKDAYTHRSTRRE